MGWVGLVEMPTEERRLVAEEGTLSKNTWPQKIARGFGDHRRAPVKGPVPPHTHTHFTPLHTVAHLHTHTPWPRCRPKKEDWLPKKDRTQRTPGCRRSQDGLAGSGELL
jgi:hypothetical protein